MTSKTQFRRDNHAHAFIFRISVWWSGFISVTLIASLPSLPASARSWPSPAPRAWWPGWARREASEGPATRTPEATSCWPRAAGATPAPASRAPSPSPILCRGWGTFPCPCRRGLWLLLSRAWSQKTLHHGHVSLNFIPEHTLEPSLLEWGRENRQNVQS